MVKEEGGLEEIVDEKSKIDSREGIKIISAILLNEFAEERDGDIFEGEYRQQGE